MKKFLLAGALVCTAILTGCSAIREMNFSPDYEGQSSAKRQVEEMPVLETVETGVTVNQIIDELNLARTSPRSYAAILKKRKQYYSGNIYAPPGQTAIAYKEGLKAVNEAIRYLESVSSMPALTYSEGLSKAAMDHVNDIGPKGKTSHTGSDGTRVNDRIERYGEWKGLCGENIMYGSYTARDIVVSLIVDDGVADRGHRRAIFTPEYSVIGTAFGYHNGYGIMCVQNFATAYNEGKTSAATLTAKAPIEKKSAEKTPAKKAPAKKVRLASKKK